MSDPKKLFKLNKIYFPNVMGSTRMGRIGYPCIGFMNISPLYPTNLFELKIAENGFIKLMVADNLRENKAQCKLKIFISDIDNMKQKLKENFIIFYLNNNKLENLEKISEANSTTTKKTLKIIKFNIPVNMVKYGLNQIEMINRGEKIIKTSYLWINKIINWKQMNSFIEKYGKTKIICKNNKFIKRNRCLLF